MWKRKSAGLEGMLRAVRAEPRREFVEGLEARVARAQRRPRVSSRLAFAGAVMTLMLGTFASFGGLGYAASTAAHAVRTVKHVAVGDTVVVHHSSADEQYPGTAPPPPPLKNTPPTNNPSSGTAAGTNNVAAGGTQGVAAASGSLPFTGLSLLVTVVVSLLMIATGLVLRRRERTDS
jgi:hypothetical protein